MFRWLRNHKYAFLVPILVLMVTSFSLVVQQCLLKNSDVAEDSTLLQKNNVDKTAHTPSHPAHVTHAHPCCSNAESNNRADAFCCDLDELSLDNLVVTTTKEDPFQQFDQSELIQQENRFQVVNAGTVYSSAYPDQSRTLTHRKLTMRNLVLLD